MFARDPSLSGINLGVEAFLNTIGEVDEESDLESLEVKYSPSHKNFFVQQRKDAHSGCVGLLRGDRGGSRGGETRQIITFFKEKTDNKSTFKNYHLKYVKTRIIREQGLIQQGFSHIWVDSYLA